MPVAEDDREEDAALARRIVATGDRAAEDALCRRLIPRLRAYGLRHLRDETGALDLAQQVMVVVIEALRGDRVRELDRLAAFVSGVARNTVLDWRRGERRRSALLEQFGPSLASVAALEPARLDHARLAGCLQALPPRERTIVALTYLVDLDAERIAGQLAMTPGNLRVARHRALRRLHDCMTRGHA